MKFYRCDQCQVEISPTDHRQVEINGVRKDVCGGECLTLIGTFKAKAEQVVAETTASRHRRISELEAEYWSLEKPVDSKT